MALYAAYGSNMDPAQMIQRCPSSPMVGTGWLTGWRLTFGGEDIGWEGALSMVVPAADAPTGPAGEPGEPGEPGAAGAAQDGDGSEVFVVLYDLADSDEEKLDSWEGADLGLYSKIRVRVHTLDGDKLAWMYALRSFEGGLPSARYLGVVADAAEAAGAPAEYVAALRRRPCRSVGG